MKPIWHAKNSARKYGGKPEDYIEIHQFMDSTKSALPDVRHRAILHSSFGCFIVERVFGYTMENSDGKSFCPRDVAEDHCIEDLGFIPSVDRWFETMTIESWMGGPVKTKKVIEYDNIALELKGAGGPGGTYEQLIKAQKEIIDSLANDKIYYDGAGKAYRESLGPDFLTERTPHDDDK